MVVSRHGKVHDGGIVFPEALDLPEGTEVVVQIEPVDLDAEPEAAPFADVTELPIYGTWADREDMADSAAWVRNERAKWQQRLTRTAEGRMHC